ncbi:MAG: chorion class high-cysteine HCB protein 13 [Christensenellaceae bacterium]
MNNCLCSDNTLWILIIILILCCCGGSVCSIFDKLTDCSCLIPLLIVFCCCCSGGKKGGGFNFGSLGSGCGCK